MISSFGDTEDVRTLSDEELQERERQMSRNRDLARLMLLRQWIATPVDEFEQKYVDVCNELQRRGLL